jgi:hypothetical protein
MRFESVGRRVRLFLGREPDDVPAEVDTPPPSRALPPEHEFIAYAEDCLLLGHIRLDAARLTDLLNDHEEYELVDVTVMDLVGERAVAVQTTLVTRDELLLVHALGPRGDRGRRLRTRQHPVALQVGPYHVRGYLHALPGSDPVASFRHRKPMIPLTEAWIEYDEGKIRQRRRVATLVVNRHQVDWIVEALDEEVELPDIPLQSEHGPLLKDFTGQLLTLGDPSGRQGEA